MAATASARPRAVIDCDLHNPLPSIQALFPYLSEHWREHCTQTGFRGPSGNAYPRGAPTSARPDWRSPAQAPRTALDLMRERVLDPWNVELGVLNCTYAVESLHNPDVAAALASAVNDWQIAEWLDKEPRLRASIVVPSQQPAMAAREIERVGGHPGFVQVFLPVRSPMLYGNRMYHPIYEAAVRHDLVIGVHFGGAPGNPPTPSGWPSYYIEQYAGMGQIFQSQVMNVVAEGVFDRFPTLRMAMIEGGWSWLPAWMWRLDKEWKGLRREMPWVRRPPSEYIREHMRFTLQPVDRADVSTFLTLIDQLGSDELVLFSTDYPHWHFDADEEVLPAGLPAELTGKIASENARAFYRW
jgi:predicted TIM-barrel fold metal-dependent hydrolase